MLTSQKQERKMVQGSRFRVQGHKHKSERSRLKIESTKIILRK
jgi:hypothetical protein